ncbi:hypothetical protein D0T49_08055 [Paludibacter sp. 221]|uniref:hypothetical protein n=1 Tax=Paludibacter sp. 221 TaxID=2302939 RepID=UPI0013D2D43A|nr:hypothetical protein [Paludibacter sp. 221]NDV46999.1 hypothetical protein [Paludibacter sp. 221]
MRQKRGKDEPSFVDTIKKYIDLKAEYYQLAFAEKVSLLVGKIVLLIFTALLSLALLLLMLLLIYNLLMTWIDIPWLVSLIEIGFIGLLMLIMWLFRYKLVINPVASSIIRSLLSSDDKEEEDEEDEE